MTRRSVSNSRSWSDSLRRRIGVAVRAVRYRKYMHSGLERDLVTTCGIPWRWLPVYKLPEPPQLATVTCPWCLTLAIQSHPDYAWQKAAFEEIEREFWDSVDATDHTTGPWKRRNL